MKNSEAPHILENPAFTGLPGDIVRAVEPFSEADPHALLLQFLIGFGNLIGPGPFFRAEEERHKVNLFGALVGRTSRARKGSSWSQVFRFLAAADPQWADLRVSSGLSSGEGLIEAVRDPQAGSIGIPDKRLLILETEFGSALRVLARSGNILSPVLRQAWDTGNLRVMSRHTAARATGAHVSLVAHITEDELRSHFHRADVFSGLANRILWLAVERSKLLASPGRLDERTFRELVERVQDAVQFSRGRHELSFSVKAQRKWVQLYEGLSEDQGGLFGASVSRAEAQVLRLAGVYALSDTSGVIRIPHLRAAMDLWRICRASALSVFGGAGRPTSLADKTKAIFDAHPQGISMTELSAALGHHVGAAELQRHLSSLRKQGYICEQTVRTKGRPRTTFRLAGRGDEE